MRWRIHSMYYYLVMREKGKVPLGYRGTAYNDRRDQVASSARLSSSFSSINPDSAWISFGTIDIPSNTHIQINSKWLA